MTRHPRPRPPGLLRAAPAFRYLWLSRSISATGTGVSRVALVLLVAPSGPGLVSVVLLATALGVDGQGAVGCGTCARAARIFSA
jgi:hypothetical protein